MDRRLFLSLAGSAVSFAAFPSQWRAVSTGRLKQAVSQQVFGKGVTLQECCKIAAPMGIKGFDFINDPKDWPLLQHYGLTVTMLRSNHNGAFSAGRPLQGVPGWDAIGVPEAQGVYLQSIDAAIDTAAQNAFPNVIVLAGDRKTVGYQDGADHAVAFLKKVKSHAEDKGVTLCMELLNSFGIEAPPMSLFDHLTWGVEVMKRVDSSRVKILFDFFHSQLMDGNIVQSIRDNIAHIGHFHVAAVPARHELGPDDELNPRFIARSIADLNFQGYVTHEWTPSPGSDIARDLERSIEIMTV